jgi:site-specific recombinase
MIQRAFQEYALNAANPERSVQLITDLVAAIRPTWSQSLQDDQAAIQAIKGLCATLRADAEKAQFLRDSILQALSERNPVSLYLIARHSVFSGFFTEIRRRISYKLLPEAINSAYLIDLFAQFFPRTTDADWVESVPDDRWLELIAILRFEDAPEATKLACQQHLIEASQVLSYRIAALGLEPELLRNHPELEKHTSPFIAQQQELARYIETSDSDERTAEINHIIVMLDQCRAVVNKIRRNSAQSGTSIQLTQLLQRMAQQIARLECLLHILIGRSDESARDHARLKMVQLFKELVYGESHKNDIGEYLRDNVEVMALRVTENASRTGEHYITNNRHEYFALMRSAMGAGVIIGIMAMMKIVFAKLHLAPLTEAILFSLNYGLGFILIHILHFTVATKQPAMTAAAIAASIDATDSKSKEMSHLIAMIANTVRSQLAAIFGNVCLAIPTAMLIAWCFLSVTGQHFITPEKAHHLLADIDPIRSGALFYAAIAGVCLFLSGLITGYHDNLAVYNKIPQRLRAVKWLQKLLGVKRLDLVAHYVENNLGALAGNFYFGCLLGGMSAIGILFGLPFDIRHIAFSAAFVGYATFALDFMLSRQTLAYAALGLTLIAMVNLTVSFSLAIYVALKSRKIRFQQWRILLSQLATRLNQHPAEFVMPPKRQSDSDQAGSDQA